MFIIPEHCVWPKMCLSLGRNQLSFTRQKQLSRAAFEHQSAAIPSGGSTSPEWCPGTPALLPPSRIWAEGPCPKIEAHWHMLLHLKSICSFHSVSMGGTSVVPLAWWLFPRCPPAFWTRAASCLWCGEAETPEHHGTWALRPQLGWNCTSCAWFHLKLPRKQIMWFKQPTLSHV